MKFYDLEDLARKCGTDNKYDITARVAARARWLSEHKSIENELLTNERYISMALLEVENGSGLPGLEGPGQTEPKEE